MQATFHGWSAVLCSFAFLSSAMADPTLDLLLAQALEQNPGLQALTHRLQRANALQREARASYYPQFGATANYVRTDNPPQAFMLQLNQRELDMRDPAFDPNAPDDTANAQLALNLQYQLYDAARSPRQQAARLQQNLSYENQAAARNALIHAVTQGYYQVLQAQAFATVQTAAQASFAESLRIAEERYASGAAVRTDVLNLEVQLAQANENLIRANNGVQLAIAALNATIGSDTICANGLQVPDTTVLAPEQQPQDERQRPERVAANLQRDLAAQHVRMARAQHWPTLYAFGSMHWDTERFDDTSESYIAGIAMQWNGFDGGRTSARIDAARAAQDAADAQIQETILNLELEKKHANLQLHEAWERIQVTERAAESAEEALRITRALYQEGAVDVATLLVAEVARTETRMRATAARYDYLIAQSNVKRAAGRFAHTPQPNETNR